MATDEQHSASGDQVSAPSVAELEYLWDEYKYRHDLCWRAIYQIVAAVVVLGTVPYLKDELTKVLGLCMLVPAVLAAVLAGFGISVLMNELYIFAKSKLAYHIRQDAFLSHRITNAEDKKFVMHELTEKTARGTPFDRYVVGFMVALSVLSVANVLFLGLRWIPHIEGWDINQCMDLILEQLSIWLGRR
jgi:hypothetical protein